MLSLCIISDTHRRHRELTISKCDILIHCGDFGSFGRDDETNLEDVDIWFAEQPARHVICVGGNHDFLLHGKEFRFAHATYLEDRSVEIEGLKIYGAPWCPDLAGFAFYATEEELRQRWKSIPDRIDILVTHTPPHGILDLPSSGLVHLGCPILKEELLRARPRLHAFGHVHAGHGTHEEGGRLSVNAAIVGGSDFEVRYGPTICTVPQGK